MLSEVWSEARGFGHRIGGPALDGSLDDQIFGVLALLDAYEARSNRATSTPRRKRMDLAIAVTATPKAAAFSIALRTPRPWAASTFAGNLFRIRRRPAPIPLRPSHCFAFTRSPVKSAIATLREKTLEAFAGIAPQYGLVRGHLWTCGDAFHTSSVAGCRYWRGRRLGRAISGAGRPSASFALENPCCASRREPTSSHLAGALKETLPHLPADKAMAIVCAGHTCLPPATDATQLSALLEKGARGHRRNLIKIGTTKSSRPPETNGHFSVLSRYFFGRDSGGTRPLQAVVNHQLPVVFAGVLNQAVREIRDTARSACCPDR